MATIPADLSRRNLRIGLYGLIGALAMLGLGFAAVPLYRMFCQVTGFAGTTQVATEDDAMAALKAASGDVISVRFDANVARGMPWNFRPEHPTQTVTIGARSMAIFLAKNNSDHPITGQASFNVEPEQTGIYFNKIQCFCFTEQTLQPGEEVRMPVLYYVDPAIQQDPRADGVEQITLSYTFTEKPGAGAASVADRQPAAAG